MVGGGEALSIRIVLTMKPQCGLSQKKVRRLELETLSYNYERVANQPPQYVFIWRGNRLKIEGE